MEQNDLFALLGIQSAPPPQPPPHVPKSARKRRIAPLPNRKSSSTAPSENARKTTPRTISSGLRPDREISSLAERTTAEDAVVPLPDNSVTSESTLNDPRLDTSPRPEEDSDDPVKHTINTSAISGHSAKAAPSFGSLAAPYDAYWMYGQGSKSLNSGHKGRGADEDVVGVVRGVDEGETNAGGRGEVKAKDFAENPNGQVIGSEGDVGENSAGTLYADRIKEEPIERNDYKEGSYRLDIKEEYVEDDGRGYDAAEEGKLSRVGPSGTPMAFHRSATTDLLEQLLKSIDLSTPSSTSTERPGGLSNIAASHTLTDAEEGMTTADESFYTDNDNAILSSRRRRFHVAQHQTRVRGSTKRRTRYQIVRYINPNKREEGPETTVEVEPVPTAATPFQRDIQSSFSHSILEQVVELAKVDNTSGNHLPSQLRDLFPVLSDPAQAVIGANHLRRQLQLPLLTTKTDKVALRRAVAQMRVAIYTEIVSALMLPLAPTPAPETDDESEKVKKKKKISLVPSALQIMQKALPVAFPEDKYNLKLFIGHGGILGDTRGKVVWKDGIGQIIGGDPYGPGFRGKVSTDGVVHVFVDHSNVLHGLTHRLHRIQSSALPPKHLRTLSLPILSLLLRRGRYTPHGSLHLVASSPVHQNLDPLVCLGWEVSTLKRVEIYDDEVYDIESASLIPKPKPNSTKVNPYPEGGSRRYKEQGVDEILHLKILQALNAKPTPAPKGSTIVLATGDAKGGQFNRDGFLGAVREAIKRGWVVELWSFSEGLSKTWKDSKKKEGWGANFSINLLDKWAEQLVEVGDGD